MNNKGVNALKRQIQTGHIEFMMRWNCTTHKIGLACQIFIMKLRETRTLRWEGKWVAVTVCLMIVLFIFYLKTFTVVKTLQPLAVRCKFHNNLKERGRK